MTHPISETEIYYDLDVAMRKDACRYMIEAATKSTKGINFIEELNWVYNFLKEGRKIDNTNPEVRGKVDQRIKEYNYSREKMEQECKEREEREEQKRKQSKKADTIPNEDKPIIKVVETIKKPIEQEAKKSFLDKYEDKLATLAIVLILSMQLASICTFVYICLLQPK